jgi:hypothetical protein
MDKDILVMAGAVVALFGFLFGGIFFGEYMRHIEKMECMRQHGEYISQTCLFRPGK